MTFDLKYLYTYKVFLLVLYLILVALIQPINCILISEDVPTISVLLSERRVNALKGVLLNKDKVEGDFYSYKPTKDKPSRWSFEKKDIELKGESILLKDSKIWHRYQNKIKSHEVNKVLFYGLSTQISKFIDDKDLIRATSGFFKIGNECYGGRIKKV